MSKATTKSAAKPVVRPTSTQSAEAKAQADQFGKAMELFHARDLKKARDYFEKASEGPNKEMAFAAKTHQRMCEQRLEKQTVTLNTPEDYYNYGVALTNRGQLAEARKNLEQALKLEEADHYHYALALAVGQAGDLEAAAKHLARAFELNPRNRTSVRNDPDFVELLKNPALQELVRGA